MVGMMASGEWHLLQLQCIHNQFSCLVWMPSFLALFLLLPPLLLLLLLLLLLAVLAAPMENRPIVVRPMEAERALLVTGAAAAAADLLPPFEQKKWSFRRHVSEEEPHALPPPCCPLEPLALPLVPSPAKSPSSVSSQMPSKWGLLLSLRIPPAEEPKKQVALLSRGGARMLPVETAGDTRPLDRQEGLGLRLDIRLLSGLAVRRIRPESRENSSNSWMA